jgi:hypothetical protein
MAEADNDLLFEVVTPLGFSVRVTKTRWELIATFKPGDERARVERQVGIGESRRSSPESKRFRSAALLQDGSDQAMGMCSYEASGQRRVSGDSLPN